MLTGPGTGVPTPSVSPSRSAFFRRNATGSAFAADRFHLDRYIPAEKADLRYANWIREGFKAGDRIWLDVDNIPGGSDSAIVFVRAEVERRHAAEPEFQRCREQLAKMSALWRSRNR